MTSIKRRREKWQELEQIFTINGIKRKWTHLRNYYQKMKVVAKQIVSIYKKHSKGTGGGAPLVMPSDDQWTLLQIAPEDFREDESAFDSEAVRTQENNEENAGYEEVWLDLETGLLNPVNPTIPETVSASLSLLEPVIPTANSKKRKKEMRPYEEEMAKLYPEQIYRQIVREEEIHALKKEHEKIKCDHTLFKNNLEVKKMKLDLEIANLQKEKIELELSNFRNNIK